MTNNELPEDTIVIGEVNYQTALDHVISRAENELLIFDQDLSKGGYASLKRCELMRNFLAGNPSNRLVMILHDATYFNNRCPHLHELLGTYSHAMSVYQTNDQAKVAKDMFVITNRVAYLHRFHVDQARFRFAFNDTEAANMLYKRYVELLEATSHRMSFTQLGL